MWAKESSRKSIWSRLEETTVGGVSRALRTSMPPRLPPGHTFLRSRHMLILGRPARPDCWRWGWAWPVDMSIVAARFLSFRGNMFSVIGPPALVLLTEPCSDLRKTLPVSSAFRSSILSGGTRLAVTFRVSVLMRMARYTSLPRRRLPRQRSSRAEINRGSCLRSCRRRPAARS